MATAHDGAQADLSPICKRGDCGKRVPYPKWLNGAEHCSDYCRNRAWREAHPRRKSSGRATWDAFYEWLENHRQVYAEFKRFAYALKSAGREKIGAKMIAERIRWESAIRKREGDEYRVNNNYVSFMAKELAREDESFAELFEFRG